jgi:uncharacterized protein (DUF1684 family)
MTFAAAVGHGNLPNGSWSPVIYSKKAIDYFRIASVVNEVTNTDYAGELKGMGDTVKIMKAPRATVRTLERGTRIDFQDVSDEDLSLVVDKANYFAFKVDDIETLLSHIGWEGLMRESGTYELANKFDNEVLTYMQANATTNSALGSDGSPKTIGYGAGNDFTPLDLLGRMARLMDENDVPADSRYAVVSPAFVEQLGREDGKLIEVQVTGDAESIVRQRKLATSRPIHGFTLFKTNNSPTSTNSSNVTVVAGHKSAVATASVITEVEKQRGIDFFGDAIKGMNLYGRKVLRPEALFTAFISIGDA